MFHSVRGVPRGKMERFAWVNTYFPNIPNAAHLINLEMPEILNKMAGDFLEK